jgi:hypothetical protein
LLLCVVRVQSASLQHSRLAAPPKQRELVPLQPAFEHVPDAEHVSVVQLLPSLQSALVQH